MFSIIPEDGCIALWRASSFSFGNFIRDTRYDPICFSSQGQSRCDRSKPAAQQEVAKINGNTTHFTIGYTLYFGKLRKSFVIAYSAVKSIFFNYPYRSDLWNKCGCSNMFLNSFIIHLGKRKLTKQPWLPFGYTILKGTDFFDYFISQFSPKFLLRLRRYLYIKCSQCVSAYFQITQNWWIHATSRRIFNLPFFVCIDML